MNQMYLTFSLSSRNQNSFLNDLKLCATSVIAPEVRTSLLTADIITAKKLNSPRIFGKVNDDYFIDDSTIVSKPVLSGKFYYRNFTAKDVFTTQLGNLNLTGELKLELRLFLIVLLFDIIIRTLIINISIANRIKESCEFMGCTEYSQYLDRSESLESEHSSITCYILHRIAQDNKKRGIGAKRSCRLHQ